MTIQYKLIMAPGPICKTVIDSADPHLQLELRPDAVGTYNPYYDGGAGPVLVTLIEVYYSGELDESTADFRLRGVTSDAGTPTVLAVAHKASGSFDTRADWSLSPTNPGQIDWIFSDPPANDSWVSWTFNPSGGGPPVKIKVVLKRQDQALADCP